MFKIIMYIIIVIIGIVLLYKSIKIYKESNSSIEKGMYIVFLFVYYIPIILYYLDKYNIPTKLGYTSNVDADRWFNFINSYFASVIGALISGAILIFVTYKQIENDSVEKDKNLKEQRRVNNMPVLKYDFNSNPEVRPNRLMLMSNGENNSNDFCILNFDLENIGLNTARNITCSLKLSDNKFKAHSVSSDSNCILKVDDMQIYGLMVGFDIRNSTTKKVIVTFFYNDLFNNHYSQDIHLTIEISKMNPKSKNYGVIKYRVSSCSRIIVKKEKLIKNNK